MDEETIVARVPVIHDEVSSQVTVSYYVRPPQVVIEGKEFSLFFSPAESEVLETAIRVARQSVRPRR